MLRLIPLEDSPKEKSKKKHAPKERSAGTETDPFFKNIFENISQFLERGKDYTVSQIDDLIMHLQRMVLRLQQKKHTILSKQEVTFKKRKIR